jgi:hypothetical protein
MGWQVTFLSRLIEAFNKLGANDLPPSQNILADALSIFATRRGRDHAQAASRLIDSG